MIYKSILGTYLSAKMHNQKVLKDIISNINICTLVAVLA